MLISQEQLLKFKEIHEEITNETIGDIEATKLSNEIIEIFKILQKVEIQKRTINYEINRKKI